MASRHSRVIALGVLVVLAACSGGNDNDYTPGVPASITLDTTAFSFRFLGETHQFRANVFDGGGDPVDAVVTWSSPNPGILHLNQSGLATAMGPGALQVVATAGAATATVAVDVSPAPQQIVAALGNFQSGDPGQELHTPLGVRVADASGFAIQGVAVTFAAGPGASVGATTATTDAQGLAKTTLTLGAALGEYTATAAIPGTDRSVTFTAFARTPPTFDIEIIYVNGSPTAEQAGIFREAEERWERIITNDLPDDHTGELPAGSCGFNSPAMNRALDDVIMIVDLGDIDGQGGILGGAAVCFVHEDGGLPAISMITFDGADVDLMESQGIFGAVAMHEMGHALGYGTLWNDTNLADPTWMGGTDPHFTGAAALDAFDDVGGSGYSGAKVPVENEGGYGTADAHWRESVFINELMTGYVDAGENPLSIVSIASMQDLGYSVDFTQADPFSIMTSIRGQRSATAFQLRNDLIRIQPKVLRNGRVVGTLKKTLQEKVGRELRK